MQKSWILDKGNNFINIKNNIRYYQQNEIINKI